MSMRTPEQIAEELAAYCLQIDDPIRLKTEKRIAAAIATERKRLERLKEECEAMRSWLRKHWKTERLPPIDASERRYNAAQDAVNEAGDLNA